MRRGWTLAVGLVVACGVWSCAATLDTPAQCTNDAGCLDVAGDTAPPTDLAAEEAVAVEVAGDEAAEPADTVETASEVTDDVPLDVTPAKVMRHFTYKAIGGMSMGAQAMTVAIHNPGVFDVMGAMGGYIDFRYMAHVIRDKLLGGFCPMDQILQHLDNLDDATEPGLNCGPVKADQPYEWDWDFNHLRYNDQGGSWQREFYLNVIGSFTWAFGNMIYYNTENPMLPPGVSMDWMTNQADKCNNPAVVGKPHNYNAEFNPEGKYNLITICDGDPAVPGGIDESACASDPVCRAKLGNYDPKGAHNLSVPYLLAVDYNGNGKRDFGEPIVINAMERFKDVGKDGCADAYEDGKGGCLAQPRANPVGDPNGDNFDLVKNPLGTERNFEYDEGEPYDDYGLDGVPGTGDFGEGDGKFSMNPNYETLINQDVRTYVMNQPAAELRKKTWYFEGGIRDALHAATSMMHITARLDARGADETVKVYDDFTRTPKSLMPGVGLDDMIGIFNQVDFSPAKFGRNALMRYGDPNATWNQIYLGDGSHIGAGSEVPLRAMLFYGLAFNRMPDPIFDTTGEMGAIIWNSYWSEAVQGRRWFVVAMPPGYDDDANKDRRYPVGLLMPGIGMPLDSMAMTPLLLEPLQVQGQLPRFIMLLPDGQCVFRRTSDGKRFPGCVRAPGGLNCVDDECKGPHESCTVTTISRDGMEQECNSGHFFVNHKTDKWGSTAYANVMKYEDSLYEVVNVVDQLYRTRTPEDREVPADW